MNKADLIVENIIEIYDWNIAYCKYGQGPNYFLFICGAVGSYKKDYPENVLLAFDTKFATIVCIDPPGYGKSRPPDRQQEVLRCKKDARYCIKLMEELNLIPFTILGWSEGGRTAIHVAGQGKKLIKSMILLATSTKIDFRGDMAFKGMRNTNQWLTNSKQPYLEHYSEEFLREQWAALCDVVAKVYSDLGGQFPSDAVLSTIKVPVLIINGGMDRFVMNPKLLTEKLSNAKIEIHAQGGHDLHIKYSKWFALKVTQFINENLEKK